MPRKPGAPSRAEPDLASLQQRLDEILKTLARFRPPFRKISGEEKDGTVRLLHPDEVAYVITKREDDSRRAGGSAPPARRNAKDPKAADDSLVIYAMSGETYRSYSTIARLKALLEGFPGCQITHRSYLVNLDQVLRVKVTPSGRELFFKGLDLPAVVSKDNVRVVETYLGLASA